MLWSSWRWRRKMWRKKGVLVEAVKKCWIFTESSLVETLWSRTESSEFCLAHLLRLDTWVSANISPALFRCYALALAAGSPGGQRGQMVHPVHQGQACRVPVPAGAAWYWLCSNKQYCWNSFCCSVCWRSSGVIDRTLYARKESSNPGGVTGDQLVGGWGELGGQRVGGGGGGGSKQTVFIGEFPIWIWIWFQSDLSSQSEAEYDFNLIWDSNLKLNTISIWFEFPIWSWILF